MFRFFWKLLIKSAIWKLFWVLPSYLSAFIVGTAILGIRDPISYFDTLLFKGRFPPLTRILGSIFTGVSFSLGMVVLLLIAAALVPLSVVIKQLLRQRVSAWDRILGTLGILSTVAGVITPVVVAAL